MDTFMQRHLGWLMPLILQALSWLGPVASKYLDKLVLRLMRSASAFEVNDYKASLEIRDSRGRLAVYTRRERFHFLRDGVTWFYDYGYGTGDTFASHRVRPGRVVERVRIGPRYRSLILLPRPQNKGDALTFEVRRLIRDGFVGERPWLEAFISNATRRLELSVTLPAARPVRLARLVHQKNSSDLLVPVRITSEGKQRLTASVSRPGPGAYTLEWVW